MSGGAVIKRTFNDGKFEIFDDGDPTKKLDFEVSEVSTSTTRTITMPDNDVDLGDMVQISGSLTDYAVVCGDGGSTSVQSVSGVGTSGQVLTSNGASSLPTWQASGGGGGITWSEVTGTSQSMAVNNGYILNNAGLVTATLPETSAVGDVIRVSIKGAGLGKIAQNAGQTIHFGSSSSTTGVGGDITATAQYDAVELLCITANTTFAVISSQGTITVT